MTIIEISRRLTQAHVAINIGGKGVARPHTNFIAIVEITTSDCIGRIEGIAAYRNRRRLREIDVTIATQAQTATITVVGIVLGPACPDANILRTAVLHTQQLSVVNCRIFAVIAVDNTATQGNAVGNLTCCLKLHGICAKVEVQAVGCLCAHGLEDRKSTRLNSSHVRISYAVFCLKKKKNTGTRGGRETSPDPTDRRHHTPAVVQSPPTHWESPSPHSRASPADAPAPVWHSRRPVW